MDWNLIRGIQKTIGKDRKTIRSDRKSIGVDRKLILMNRGAIHTTPELNCAVIRMERAHFMWITTLSSTLARLS
jgi:hypothetical protein